jgi:hypothetical protein
MHPAWMLMITYSHCDCSLVRDLQENWDVHRTGRDERSAETYVWDLE